MTQGKRISRRTVLRGMGAAMGLPWLEAMMPRTASAGDSGGPPLRMAFLFVPNGMHMPAWMPEKEGPLEKLPLTLEPLAEFKSEILVLSGLTLDGGRPHGDGPGDHARCVGSFLTGAHPYKTNGKDIRNGVSVDQVAAQAVGEKTRFPSLELGCEPSAQAGHCDSGYSCAYTSNMSWRTPSSFMPKEINPRAVFDRLFGDADQANRSAGLTRQQRYRKSILDFVAEDAKSLRRDLGVRDQRKLDEYLHAVREIEDRIDKTDKLGVTERGASNFPRPAGTPEAFDEHVRVMMDMMVLAWQTDATRITTFMYTNAGSNRSYPDIGAREGHHTLSHHGNDPEKQAKIAKINRHHVSLLAHFLERLRSVREGDATLLDRAMIMYGSGLGDGNRHNHDHLPILVAGRGGGTVKPGRHLSYPKETPLANLYRAMLHRMGVKADSFADSTGPLEDLA